MSTYRIYVRGHINHLISQHMGLVVTAEQSLISGIIFLNVPGQLQPITELLHLLHHFNAVRFIISKVIPVLCLRRQHKTFLEDILQQHPSDTLNRLKTVNLAAGPEFLSLFFNGLLLNVLLLFGLKSHLLGLLFLFLLHQTSSLQLRLSSLQHTKRTCQSVTSFSSALWLQQDSPAPSPHVLSSLLQLWPFSQTLFSPFLLLWTSLFWGHRCRPYLKHSMKNINKHVKPHYIRTKATLDDILPKWIASVAVLNQMLIVFGFYAPFLLDNKVQEAWRLVLLFLAYTSLLKML